MNNKKKKIIICVIVIVTCMLLALGGGNVYATKQGYNNIFSMLRDLVTTGTITKENVLSDKNITISLKYIEITEGIKMQINKLGVNNNEAKLYLKIDKSNVKVDVTPFTYKVIDENGKILFEGETTQRGITYTEELLLKDYEENTKKLQLEVNLRDNTNLAKFEIDLVNREIQVIGSETELEKISEEELKKYLSAFAFLKFEDENMNKEVMSEEILENERKMFAAKEIAELNNLGFYNGTTTMGMHYYELVDTEIAHEIMKNFTEIELEDDGLIKLGDIYFTKNKVNGKMRYVDIPNPEHIIGALCIDIKDIIYSNGIYTVTFTYCYPTSQDEIDNKIEDLSIYEMTLALTINEEQKYSKYRVSDIIESKLIKSGKTVEVIEGEDGPIYVTKPTLDESISKFVETWTLSYIMVNEGSDGFEEPISKTWGDTNVSIEIKEDGTFIETRSGSSGEEQLKGIYEKIDDNTIKRTYEDKTVIETKYETNSFGETVISNASSKNKDRTEYYLVTTNSIKESLIGTWWRTYNVDHDEENLFNLNFRSDGTFIEYTMKETLQSGTRYAQKTGKGTFRYVTQNNWDVIILTYENGETHELLYGAPGSDKENQKLHYSAGRQLFEKFKAI